MNLFSFYGAVKRKEYWLTSLAYFAGAFIGVVAMMNQPTFELGLVITLIVCYMGMVLTTKRIRDTGCSGWFIIIYALIGIIPYVGFVGQVIWMCLPTNHFEQYKK